MQLDLLWDFMQTDMEADNFESAMRQAPNRVKLLKQRDFLVEQQNNIKKIEADVVNMADRVEAVKDEARRLQGVLDALIKQIDEKPPATDEDIKKQMEAAQKLVDDLSGYEQELQKMRKDSESRDRQQKEIRVRAARIKADFDQLKMEYDKEFKQDTAKLKKLKAQVEQESKKIDPILLKRYMRVKSHAMPPMAKLNDERCGECNMSLPSAVLHRVRAGEEIVECDNCGRILYMA